MAAINLKIHGAAAKHPFDPEVFRHDERKAALAAYETRRVASNAVLQERNLLEARFGNFKRAECEQLLDRAYELEDVGKLEAAVKLYQKALALEPEHLELRQYIDTLNARINAAAAAQKHASRQQLLSQQMKGEGRMSSLPVEALVRDPAFPRRGRACPGAAVAVPQKVYAQELREQMREGERLRAAARAREEELDQKELAYAQLQVAIGKYNQHVAAGNAKMAFKNEMRDRIEDVKCERMRKWELENAHDPSHAVAGPLIGLGERDARYAAAELRHRTLEWHRQQEKARAAADRPWSDAAVDGESYMRSNTPAYASGPGRPSSAYPAYRQQPSLVAHGQTQRHGRASGAGIGPSAQYLTPGAGGWQGNTHQQGGGYAPQYSQQQQYDPRHDQSGGVYHRQYQFAPATPSVSGRQRPMSAPKGRPSAAAAAPFGIDRPAPPIRISDVRARQEAYYAKHYKPPTPLRLGHQHVTPADYKRPIDWAGFDAADRLALGKR